jgi:hypothetical protein
MKKLLLFTVLLMVSMFGYSRTYLLHEFVDNSLNFSPSLVISADAVGYADSRDISSSENNVASDDHSGKLNSQVKNNKNPMDGLTQVLYYTSRNPTGGNGHLVVLGVDPPVIQDFEPTDMQRPYGITADTAHRKVYITDYSIGAIYRFDADGRNPMKILDVNVAGQELVGDPEGIFVLGDKIYWGRTGGIYRANLDGTNPEPFIVTGMTALEFPLDMQYNPSSGKIYLVNDKTDFSGGYFSIKMDGSELTEYIQDIDGTALEVDFGAGKTYLAIYGSAGTPVTVNGIYSCNLDGSGLTKIADFGTKATWGVAMDHTRNKLFWGYKISNSAPDGKIIRANMDGSGQEDWITGVSPHAMEVDWINLVQVNVPVNNLPRLQVYPNPVTDQLFVSGDFNNARVILCTADGRIVYTSENESQRASIHVSAFARGLYILRIETLKGVVTQKVALIK